MDEECNGFSQFQCDYSCPLVKPQPIVVSSCLSKSATFHVKDVRKKQKSKTKKNLQIRLSF